MSELNVRVVASMDENDPEITSLDAVSKKLRRFGEELASRGNWTKCGFVPRPTTGNVKTASEVRSTGIVEYTDIENPVGNGRGFVLPDIRIGKVVAAADKLGEPECIYLSSDGLLSHYDLSKGIATPCLEKEGSFVFQEEHAVPFRGDPITRDELR